MGRNRFRVWGRICTIKYSKEVLRNRHVIRIIIIKIKYYQERSYNTSAPPCLALD
jgi:hypothetical protein